MQHNNDDNAVERNNSGNGAESSENADLEWLIEQEYAEEPEQLFALLEEELDCSLSPLEAEIAARPMMSGDRNLDDLSTYVREEIVLGDSDTGSDIYAKNDAHSDQGDVSHDVPMAIDHSKSRLVEEESIAPVLDDGADILGLAEEDDIGEQFLVIKKVPAETAGAQESNDHPSTRAVGGDDQREQEDTPAPRDVVAAPARCSAEDDVDACAASASSREAGIVQDAVTADKASAGSLAEMAEGLDEYEVLASEFQPGLDGIPEATVDTPGAPDLTAESAIDNEPATGSDQRRLVSIVRTSPTTGYYVDIFRSRRRDGQDKKHEYYSSR